MSCKITVFNIGLILLCGLTTSALSQDFGKQVRPILADKCFACHGPDDAQRQADLRLDQLELAVEQGALSPGKPEDSELIRRINSADPEVRMPPPDAAKQLSESEKRTLTDWVSKGAHYERHWAFVSPQLPQAPAVKASEWVKNPIDRFVLARLEAANLRPSPIASPTTLIRRLYLDLIGLPPSLAVLDEWVPKLTLDSESDEIDNRALGQLVDHLLESQHYGERWGQQWLDVARYADSDGFEKDKPRFVWAYRDWVISAFNRDLPYDQFVIEQIAGDLLQDANEDQIVATGFLRNSMINEEGGIDPEQFRMEAMFDRIDAIGKGILGLTIQCAQCHNHKFDPITQREYYRLFAFLNNCHEANMAVYTAQERVERDGILGQIEMLEEQLRQSNPDWPEQMATWERKVIKQETRWTTIRPEEDTSGGQKHNVLEDSSILASGYAPTRHETTFHAATDISPVTAVRLELLNDANLPRNGPGRSILGLCALTDFKVSAAPADDPDRSTDIPITAATASVNPGERELEKIFDDRSEKRRVTGPIEYAIDGKDETAWGIDIGPGRSNVPRQAVFVLKKPIESSATRLTLRLRQMHGGWNSDDNQNNNLGRFRFSVTADPGAVADKLPAEVRRLLEISAGKRTSQQMRTIFSYWRTTVESWKEVNDQIEQLWQQHPAGSTQLVLRERERARTTSMLERGNFLKPTDPVQPGTPSFLHAFPETEQPATRLDFARWLVSRDSPTVARAFVNRVWQSYFGTGIVATSEDLGSQCEPPSHAALLDWLAVSFMEDGWRLKRLHRRIVMSATYQQTSRVNPGDRGTQVDPPNRLLWHFPRQRVDGETVRDIALSASGLLNSELGGPSTHPPAPEFLFQPPASYGPKVWIVDSDSNRYRRSLYTFKFRSVPYPVLQNFDVPTGDSSCVKRAVSNTPLQALTTLNQITFLDAARALAWKTLEQKSENDHARLDFAFRRCTARHPTDQELAELLDLLDSQRSRYGQDEASSQSLLTGDPLQRPPQLKADESASEAAAWTVVARVLLNLDEAITKE